MSGETQAEAWDLRGGSLWLDREQWGVVIDALIQHRGHADQRKAVNSESTSDVRSDMCADLIRLILDRAERTAERDEARAALNAAAQALFEADDLCHHCAGTAAAIVHELRDRERGGMPFQADDDLRAEVERLRGMWADAECRESEAWAAGRREAFTEAIAAARRIAGGEEVEADLRLLAEVPWPGTCSTCGMSLDSPPCTRNPVTGQGGHTSGGGVTNGGTP